MQTQYNHPHRATPSQPSPVEIWQKLLTHLLLNIMASNSVTRRLAKIR